MQLERNDAPLDHLSLGALVARLGASQVCRVTRQAMYPAGRCYWNVADHVRKNGGETLFGWAIFEVKGLFLFAWHHAVWKPPSGPILDISSPPDAGFSMSTTFARDPRQQYDIGWPLGLPQIFEPISDAELVRNFIHASDMLHAFQLRKQEELKNVKGARYDIDNMVTYVLPQDAKAIAELQEISGRYDHIIGDYGQMRASLLRSLIRLQSELLGRQRT